MKKQNDSKVRNLNPSHFEQKQRAIMKRKIEFLQLQISQSSRRQSALKHTNDMLRSSLNELNSDKGRVLSLIENDRKKELQSRIADLTQQNDNLRAQNNQQQAKLQHISEFLERKYKEELRRVEEQAEEQIRKLEEKNRDDRGYYQKKIRQYESTIEKYNRVHQCSERLDFLQPEILRKRKCLDDFNQTNASQHLQSFSTLIPQANYTTNMSNFSSNKNFSINQSYFDLPKQNGRSDNSLLDDLQPIPLRCLDQPRQSINRSKSIMVLDTSLYSSCKPKTIATSLFCTKCEKNYQPNEYYRHLKKCEEESKVVSRLLQKRDNIEKQISAMKRKEVGEEVVDRVVVVLKNKDRMSVTSRPKVR